MIDQKQADYYKQHYQAGCCSHSNKKPINKEEDSKIIKIVL